MTFIQERQLMTQEFTYQAVREMAPRPGVTYQTRYYKQTDQQRQQLVDWFKSQLVEIISVIEGDMRLEEAQHWPLRGFPRTRGQQNRSLRELLEDTAGEILKVEANWGRNDFAEAPITRWNKFFRGSRWEFTITESLDHQIQPQTTFNKLFKGL